MRNGNKQWGVTEINNGEFVRCGTEINNKDDALLYVNKQWGDTEINNGEKVRCGTEINNVEFMLCGTDRIDKE